MNFVDLWGSSAIDDQNKSIICDDIDILSLLGTDAEWHIEGRGAGTGAWVGAILGLFGAEADLSGYTMAFTIKKTGETFQQKINL